MTWSAYSFCPCKLSQTRRGNKRIIILIIEKCHSEQLKLNINSQYFFNSISIVIVIILSLDYSSSSSNSIAVKLCYS